MVVALLGALLVAPLVGLVLGVVVGAVVAMALHRSATGAVRRAVGGRPADPVTHARLVNLVDKLATGAGVPVPDLVVVDDEAPNALAAGLEPRTGFVAVTTGLLGALDRVQLEGVLAHELARLKSHDTRPGTVAVPLLRWFGWVPSAERRITASALGPGRLAEADLQGVAITRYPPALAAALARLAADGRRVAAPASVAHLWIDPPLGDVDPLVRPPLEERIAALREL